MFYAYRYIYISDAPYVDIVMKNTKWILCHHIFTLSRSLFILMLALNFLRYLPLSLFCVTWDFHEMILYLCFQSYEIIATLFSASIKMIMDFYRIGIFYLQLLYRKNVIHVMCTYQDTMQCFVLHTTCSTHFFFSSSNFHSLDLFVYISPLSFFL